MYQGLRISRAWLALVLALFCLPLFVGLDRTDVGNDEAIYTFGVDRILEIGDWLAPKSSPHENDAFLEKPPLKFWIVAAPIKAGLLPHNEFGIRFWDALFGALSFVYVFLIGSRLIGPACGVVAVLVLFVHQPLLFEHGLRSNNMEAALVLCYCGGVYHFLEWMRRTPEMVPGPQDPAYRAPNRHAYATGLYFSLGFMCKFVAAGFLPVVLLTASLVAPDFRRKLLAHLRVWLKVALLVVAICAPWFVYAYLRFGSYFWTVIFSEHVYRRFSEYLDPAHLAPWYYYFREIYLQLSDSSAAVAALGGLIVLLAVSIRRRSGYGLTIVLWAVLPVSLVSLGSSKLYHYAYPFIPPLGIAAGYLVALVIALAPVPVSRAIGRLTRWAHQRAPRPTAFLQRPVVRGGLLAIMAASLVLAVVSVTYGPVRLEYGGTTLFRSSGVARPALVAMLCGVLAGSGARAVGIVVPLLVISLLPLAGYRETFSHLNDVRRPWSASVACILPLQQAGTGGAVPGLYVDIPDRAISHPMYYYLRRLRPWTRVDPNAPAPAALGAQLYGRGDWRPVLVWDKTYQQFRNGVDGRGPDPHPSPALVEQQEAMLLLPGPYARCADEANYVELR